MAISKWMSVTPKVQEEATNTVMENTPIRNDNQDKNFISKKKLGEIFNNKPLGTTDEGIIDALVNQGFSIEGYNPSPIVEQKDETKDNITKGIETFKTVSSIPGKIGGAAISETPSIVGNVAGFVTDVADFFNPIDNIIEAVTGAKKGTTKFDLGGLADQFRKDGIESKAKLQEVLGIDPTDFTTTLGELGADVGSLFIPGGQELLATKIGSGISKIPGAIDKINKVSKGLENIAQKAPKTFKFLKDALSSKPLPKDIGKGTKLLSNAVTGAKEIGKFDIITKGETSPESLALGAVANPLIGKTIRGIGTISKKLSSMLELSGLLNSAKLDVVAKQLQVKGIEDVGSVSDFLLKKNIKGSKQNIVKTLSEDATNSKKTVDTLLASIKKPFKSNNDTTALEILKRSLLNSDRTVKFGLEKDLDKFRELFIKSKRGEGLTLTEKNKVKRGLDKFVRIFKDNGETIAGTNQEGAKNIRNILQKEIEDIASNNGIKNIKALNKNTQVGLTLAEAIARKESSDQASVLVNAFAPSGVGAFGGAFAPADDNFERLKNIIGGIVIGKVAGSTTVKTNVANLINKLSGLEKVQLEEFIKTKGKAPLSDEIINKFIK